MDRDEQVALQPPRHAVALAQHQIPVVAPRQRHAHAPRRQQFVTDGFRDLQRHVLLAQSVRPDRARIDAAMPRIDHHQRPRVVALHARQFHAPRLGRHRDRHLVPGPRRRTEIEREEVQRPGDPGLRELGVVDRAQRQRQLATLGIEPAIGDDRRLGKVEHHPHPRPTAAHLRDAGHETARGNLAARSRAGHVDRDLARFGQHAARGIADRLVEADDDPPVTNRDALHGRRPGGDARQPAGHEGDYREHPASLPCGSTAGPAKSHDTPL